VTRRYSNHFFTLESKLLHAISAEYLDNYQLKITFNNGIEGIVDLEQELYGEIFEPLKGKIKVYFSKCL